MGRRSEGSSTPGRTTAAGRSRWSSCACSKFGERRMLPIDDVVAWGGVLRRRTRACRSRTRPGSRAGVHKADDPYRALGVLAIRGPGRCRYRDAAMAPQLWLLRHGEAVPHESKPDAERELTPRGERQAIAAGEGLAKLGLEFDACYTSPKVRARDTARLACEALNIEPIEEDVAGRRLRPRRRARAAAAPRARRARAGGRPRAVVLAGRARPHRRPRSTSRRAASRPCAPSARAASCSCCCARASWSRSR